MAEAIGHELEWDSQIENDGADRLHESVRPFNKKINETSAGEIIDIIRQAGIADYAKIQSAAGRVSTLIINGAESDPFVTAAHRLMLEQPELIINGSKILLKVLGLKKCVIATEDNKLNAAGSLNAAAKKSKMTEIKILKAKYPQSGERQIIYALTGKEVAADKQPADRGCVVVGAETAAAICRVFTEGMPLIDRVVTVDGDCITAPKNLRVPIGTPISALIEYCGLKKSPGRIIMGGAMTGISLIDINTPVVRDTSAILVFSYEKIRKNNRKTSDNDMRVCIRCGRCAESCPMYLQPLYLVMFAQYTNENENGNENIESFEEYGIASCTECGCCQYICPSGVPVTEHIRTAKRQINERSDLIYDE